MCLEPPPLKHAMITNRTNGDGGATRGMELAALGVAVVEYCFSHLVGIFNLGSLLITVECPRAELLAVSECCFACRLLVDFLACRTSLLGVAKSPLVGPCSLDGCVVDIAVSSSLHGHGFWYELRVQYVIDMVRESCRRHAQQRFCFDHRW